MISINGSMNTTAAVYSSMKDDEHDKNHTPFERYMYDIRDIEVSRLSKI
ncbi:MAG: hypothetical protein V8R64_02235 [Thomasclavelia sp.]